MDIRKLAQEALDIPVRLLEVPEWETKIEIRGLMAYERAEILERFTDETGIARLTAVSVPLVVHTCYDPETGERVFTEEDAEWLRRKSGQVIERIAAVAAELSGLAPGQVDAEGKGSSSTTTNDSASTSPSDLE